MGASFPAVPAWAAAVAAAALIAGWAAAGQAVLVAAAALALHAVFRPAGRPRVLSLAAALAWGCVLALGWHFAMDGFALRYVWLYSSAELPLHLKLANVWGGDEGTTLLLAACCLSLAASGARAGADAARWSVAAAIAAWYALTAAWLAPFAATPAEWLAQAPSQGMNAHLMKIWMLFHAPLVVLAYAWTLSLAAPALAALRGAQPAWPGLARARARRAWAVLTAGIGFGMVWAFEDAMYGQVWHWDPVQTAAFCLWCFLCAHLHGVAGWAPGRKRGWAVPWAALLAALMAPLAMAVTRNPMLASSHRYVGADSWIVHFALGIVLLLAGLGCALVRSGRGGKDASPRAASGIGLWLAQLGLLAAGVAALAQLAFAFGAQAGGMPRPEEYKPFLAMLVNLMPNGSELDALRQAFDQWDVDGYVLARLLLAPLVVLGGVGGWYFFRRLSKRAGWASLALAAALAMLGAEFGGLLTRGYAGMGILSQSIVALLPLLDASLVAGAYLAAGCLAWAGVTAWRLGWKGVSVSAPLAAIHAGVVLMLWGGMMAIALNSYSQHELLPEGGLAEAATGWVKDRHGYTFRLAGVRFGDADDGARRGENGIRAVTTVEVRGARGEIMDGQTLYRDSRSLPERYDGPMRQVCELLDYRYARHVTTPGYLLDPLIDHGWGRSVQFWISPAALLEAAAANGEPPVVVAVVKVFPFVSLLWTGLVVAALGGLWLALLPQREVSAARGSQAGSFRAP
ncbi:cytochrome c biogenesis protein CcsA [Thauera butanivorans]|uniref:cytochrome c biogenesis protein CcsA n=1 Tax=Thauera butanivorans TaxID=86174 RepID=UPI003AB1E4E9